MMLCCRSMELSGTFGLVTTITSAPGLATSEKLTTPSSSWVRNTSRADADTDRARSAATSPLIKHGAFLMLLFYHTTRGVHQASPRQTNRSGQTRMGRLGTLIGSVGFYSQRSQGRTQ